MLRINISGTNKLALEFVDKMSTSHFHTILPAIEFLIVSQKHARTSTQRALTSAGELGTMSKNNLKEITFGIRPMWRINSLTSYSLGGSEHRVGKETPGKFKRRLGSFFFFYGKLFSSPTRLPRAYVVYIFALVRMHLVRVACRVHSTSR